MGNAEEAFNYYRQVFKTEFSSPPVRIKDLARNERASKIVETDDDKLIHVALPIPGGIQLKGNDMMESMGHWMMEGNNFTINLSPDTREEADRLYKELSENGSEGIPPHEEFWGYWGTCLDQFGIRWMFNIMNTAK